MLGSCIDWIMWLNLFRRGGFLLISSYYFPLDITVLENNYMENMQFLKFVLEIVQNFHQDGA
jgi:hypothetical protein